MIRVTVLMVLGAWVAVSGPAALLVAWFLRAHPPAAALPAPHPSAPTGALVARTAAPRPGHLAGSSRSAQ